MGEIFNSVKSTIAEFEEVDEDGYCHYDFLVQDTDSNLNYEILKAAVAKCGKIERQDVMNIMDRFGFVMQKGIEEFHDESDDNYRLKAKYVYESLDKILGEKVDFDITADKEIMLRAVKQRSDYIQYASPELQSLCKGEEPARVLEAVLLAEKMHAEVCGTKSQTKSKQHMQM